MRNSLIKDRVLAIGSKIGSGSVDSILANLYQNILVGLGINTTRFNFLMEKFLSDRNNAIRQNIKDRSSARGNLRKELLKAVMSWKVFCKGLRFLYIYRFKLTVELHHLNGDVTLHSTPLINLGDHSTEDDNGGEESLGEDEDAGSTEES